MHYSSSTKRLQISLNNNKIPQQTFWKLSKQFGQQHFAKDGERQNADSRLLAVLAQPLGLSIPRSLGDTSRRLKESWGEWDYDGVALLQ